MLLRYRKITLPLTTQPARDLVARFLDRLHLQAGLRRSRPSQPFPGTILAIRRTAATHLNPPLLQTCSCRPYPRISRFRARRELHAYEDDFRSRDGWQRPRRVRNLGR